MILLLGGISETSRIAESLAAAGYPLLVSTATDIPLHVGTHPAIQRRAGALDETGLEELIASRRVRAIVDATHPYAVRIRETARQTASQMGIPYLTYIRPAAGPKEDGIIYAESHKDAARAACSFRSPIFLTIGSRNLAPYVEQARMDGVEFIARVLPQKESVRASILAGVREERIITGRGPFSVEENRALIRKFKIGVLVTKDGGVAGGLPDKIEAARLENCKVVVLRRPPRKSSEGFENIAELVRAVRGRVPLPSAPRGRTGK